MRYRPLRSAPVASPSCVGCASSGSIGAALADASLCPQRPQNEVSSGLGAPHLRHNIVAHFASTLPAQINPAQLTRGIGVEDSEDAHTPLLREVGVRNSECTLLRVGSSQLPEGGERVSSPKPPLQQG